MTDETINLDAHRGTSAQKETEERRRTAAVVADQAELRRRRDSLEDFLSAGPAESWPELAEKAAFLIALFAQTPEGRDPRHCTLIEGTLADMRRLANQEPPGPAGSGAT